MACCVPGCTTTFKANKEISLHLFPHPTKEPERHKAWIRVINNPKIFTRDPMLIYKQFRVCRLHFAPDCFNGACKRLLNTATPSLKLGPGFSNKNQVLEYESRIVDLLKANSVTIEEEEVTYEICSIADTDSQDSENNHTISIDTDDFQFKEITSDRQSIKMQETYELREPFEEIEPVEVPDNFDSKKFEIIEFEITSDYANESETEKPKPTRIQQAAITRSQLKRKNSDTRLAPKETKLLKKSSEPEQNLLKPLSEEVFQDLRTEFYKCPKNRLAQNVCSRVDPFDVALSRGRLETTQHVFNYKIETEGKPVTNQKSSGRCWNFATLNVIRIPFMKQHNIEEFEFSQAHLFYWDKIERSYFFLNNIVDTARRGETVDGRLVQFLLSDPTCDGGQWDMIVNLINKHGLIPKKCFPESFSCESSGRMNAILKSKLRQYAKEIRELIDNKCTNEDLQKKIDNQMNEIYNVVGICLGIPPETFTWEYYDKTKKFNSVGPIKPTEFYEKYVKPYFNVDDKVCLVTDPRPTNPYGKAYTVDCLGNILGGRSVLYNNQPVELLMELVAKSLKNGEPVWFGCEVSKRFAGKQGIEDLEIHDFKLVFGVDIQTTMGKADRLLYGESLMTHAMAFTGVSLDKNGEASKFRVENSWGEDRGEKGYLIMTAEWFKEFVFEVVVDKSLVPDDVMKVFSMTPIVLPAWDPMGNLAK